MERAVEILVLVQCLVVGVSHMVAPRTWGRFFDRLRSNGDAGVFVMAFLSLWFGSVIVAFHNVWHGLPMVVTLLGWAQVLKSTIYFCFPAFGLRKIAMVSEEKSHLLVYGGGVLVLATLLVTWGIWRN